jgi:hypothetical protein
VTPIGVIAVAALESVPVCGAVPEIVKVTDPPDGKVVIVLVTVLIDTITLPHAAPPVGVPQVAPMPVMPAGKVSLKLVPFAASGPALDTTTV